MRNLLNEKSAIHSVSFSFPAPPEQSLPPSPLTAEAALSALMPLFEYVQARNYEGYDLFDGLNSRLFKSSPLYQSQLFRLALIQFCKQSPVNLRSLLMVPGGFNPKGGALFLMGNLNLMDYTHEERYANEAYILFQRLKHECISSGQSKAWGYNFDWQARAFFVPKGVPNLVTSVYVGRALMQYFNHTQDPEALELALGVAYFLLRDMIQHEDAHCLCFHYIPGKDAEVHNANLLGAAYLAQMCPYFSEPQQQDVKDKILKAARFSTVDVASDGAWPYGTKSFHRWIDNFHTAFNIESLIYVQSCLKTEAFLPVLKQVIDYYLENLFTSDGLPKYYNTRLYPIDIHVIAETVVLFQLLRSNGLVWNSERMLEIEAQLLQLIVQFQNKQGFFYYQKRAKGWNRIPYIRWGQAWMFYALSTCLRAEKTRV